MAMYSMAMPSYYRHGFGKAPTERTKEAQAIVRHRHAIFGEINTASDTEYVSDSQTLGEFSLAYVYSFF